MKYFYVPVLGIENQLCSFLIDGDCGCKTINDRDTPHKINLGVCRDADEALLKAIKLTHNQNIGLCGVCCE